MIDRCVTKNRDSFESTAGIIVIEKQIMQVCQSYKLYLKLYFNTSVACNRAKYIYSVYNENYVLFNYNLRDKSKQVKTKTLPPSFFDKATHYNRSSPHINSHYWECVLLKYKTEKYKT